MRTAQITLRALHRELYRSLIKEATAKQRKYTPRIHGLFQENFIRHISLNTYFSPKERKVLVAYFDQNRSLNEAKFMQVGSRVLLRESADGKMNEGLSSWLGGVWDKIKTAFGNLKKMITEMVIKVKNFLVESGKKMYDKAIAAMKAESKELTAHLAEVLLADGSKKTNEEEEGGKIESAAKIPGGKPQLLKEAAHLKSCKEFITNPLEAMKKSLVTAVPAEEIAAKAENKIETEAEGGGDEEGDEKGGDDKKVEKGVGGLQEAWRKIHQEINEGPLFDERFTRMLVEEEELSADITKPEVAQKWGKLKKGIKIIKITLSIITAILSPIGAFIGVLAKKGFKQVCNWGAKLIAKLGGPAAIEYLVIPAAMALGSKFIAVIHDVYNAASAMGAALLSAIPVIGPTFETAINIIGWMFITLGAMYVIHYSLMTAEEAEKALAKDHLPSKDLPSALAKWVGLSEKKNVGQVKENYLRNTNRYPSRVYALK